MDNTVSVLYPYLIQFVVTLCTVAFKGFQTKNIMGNHYKLARFEQSSLCVSLEAEIAQAEALIDDFESGRKTPEWKKEKAK